MPAHATSISVFQSLSFLNAGDKRMRYAVGNTQMIRTAIVNKLTPAAYSVARPSEMSPSDSTTTGSCKPISRNTKPLSRKLSVDHTLPDWTCDFDVRNSWDR